MIAAFLAPLLMGLERLTSPRLWKMASDLSGDGAITHLFLAARGFFAIDFFGADVFLEKAEVSVQRALARFHVSYFVFVPTPSTPKNTFPTTDTETNPFTNIPTLRETPVTERADLFRRKLLACSVVFDFNSDAMGKEKECKRQTLLEIVE